MKQELNLSLPVEPVYWRLSFAEVVCGMVEIGFLDRLVERSDEPDLPKGVLVPWTKI